MQELENIVLDDVLDNMKKNNIYKTIKEKFIKYDVKKYMELCITKINCTIFVWIFFSDYYSYMIAILLLNDNMQALSNNQNNVSPLLYIPWFLFNGIFNFCTIGCFLNLFFTLILFNNQSLCYLVSKKMINYWNTISSINYKKILEKL